MTSDQHKRIEVFYLEMYDQLFLYAQNALKNESLAEEAIQETFRIVCTKPEDFLSSPNPKGWIINTLKYTMQNMRRNRDRTNALLKVTYENVAHSEEFRLIKEMAVEGKSHLEMAQSRGISVAACKKRVQRAKEFLRRKI